MTLSFKAHPRIGMAAAVLALTATSADGRQNFRAPKVMPDVTSVVLKDVAARSGPGLSYDVALQLRRGQTVYVDSAVGGWCMINSAEGTFVICSALKPPKGGWVIGKTVKKSCWPKCGD